MKVGMIFECADDGPDYRVCKHLAERIIPNIVVVPDMLGNKRKLRDECGESAKALFADGCEKVLIIWDLYPSFKRNEDPCRHRDKELILESLGKEGVDLSRVELVCVEAELESWLVADFRAVRDVLRRRNPKAKIGKLKRALQSKDPKKVLDAQFRKWAKAPYEPHNHAEEIVKAMPNLRRLNHVESFRRFKTKLMG